MEIAPVADAVASIADTAATSSAAESASASTSSASASIPSTSTDKAIPTANTVMPSSKDLNEITSSPSPPVEANAVVTQNVPKMDTSTLPAIPTRVDRTAPSNFNTTTFDMKNPSGSQGFNMMSGIKSYFNQPIQNRSNYPNFSSPTTKASDSWSKLSNAMMFGPRLSLDPTINFNSRQQQTTSTNGVGSQKSI